MKSNTEERHAVLNRIAPIISDAITNNNTHNATAKILSLIEHILESVEPEPPTHNQRKGDSAEEILFSVIPKDCFWEDMGNLCNCPKRYVVQAMQQYANTRTEKLVETLETILKWSTPEAVKQICIAALEEHNKLNPTQ